MTGLSSQTAYTITVFGTNAQGDGPTRSITVQTAGRLQGELELQHSQPRA